MAKLRLLPNRASARAVLPSVDAVVAQLRPAEPLLCLRPAAIAAAARRFVGSFPGDVLYAVKCNPEPRVLRALWAGGVRHFDCASLAEVRLVCALLPTAEIHFMHPVKARPAIAEAFDRCNVTDFALDSADELAKILQETVPVGLVGDPPPLGAYIDAVRAGAAALPDGVRLWTEPGRALVAGGGSVVVQVQLRRGDALYVNDGVYGNLSDAGALGFRFPARRIRLGDSGADAMAEPVNFALFGPTCDSADHMKGPFRLPADVREGDWIELGQLGAYGACLSSRFNGFGPAHLVEVADPPMLPTPGY